MHNHTTRTVAGAHLIYGRDGSKRNRLIVARWYVEITLRGCYINVGWL